MFDKSTINRRSTIGCCVCVSAGDAWVEVHHSMPLLSLSIKAQLAGALSIGSAPPPPTRPVVDVFD